MPSSTPAMTRARKKPACRPWDCAWPISSTRTPITTTWRATESSTRAGRSSPPTGKPKVNRDVPLDHGSVIEVGKQRIEVLFTPGDYLIRFRLLVNGQKLIMGDTLFVGCIGGSGFRGSSSEKQFHSLSR